MRIPIFIYRVMVFYHELLMSRERVNLVQPSTRDELKSQSLGPRLTSCYRAG